MNSTLLFRQFSTALNWNALLYTIYKASFTLRTFILYRILTVDDFSTWAILNSTIFLTLLWADCGLRKSIPRYAPIVNQRFLYNLIIFYTIILTACTPLLIWLLSCSSTVPIIILLAVGIFITEGIQTVIRLIYHSYFHNKSFNLIASSITLIEMVVTLSIIGTTTKSFTILYLLLMTKFVSSLILIVTTLMGLHKQPAPLITQPINTTAQEHKSFIIHSLAMWISTILKSLSERNFLVPLFTYTLGAGAGNLFKVANDGASFFYRIILKTIGTADTALLSHVEIDGNEKLMTIAFKKLTTKVANLCFPLLGIISCIMLISLYNVKYNQFVFYAFLIMAVSYIIETTLLPYERVLEVKREYKTIFFCYIPYIITIILLIIGLIMASVGLLNAILIIHGVRLVSCLLMRHAVYKLYGM